MNKHRISLGCAVAKQAEFTYYCEVHQDRYHFKEGVYTYTASRNQQFKFLELTQFSDRIWRQGPKGGVKIVKSRNEFHPSQYITKDEKLMEQFMWVKLKARDFNKGA